MVIYVMQIGIRVIWLYLEWFDQRIRGKWRDVTGNTYLPLDTLQTGRRVTL